MAKPRALANASSVAQTLNRLTDRAFTEALSASDRDAMTQLMEDYFCDDRECEEQDQPLPDDPLSDGGTTCMPSDGDEEVPDQPDTHLILNMDDMVREIIDGCSQPVLHSTRSTVCTEEGSEEGRKEGHEEGRAGCGLGVESGGLGDSLGGEVVAGGAADHLEQRAVDVEEEQKITEFVRNGCGCRTGKKGPCSTLFTREHYQNMRADAAALTWSELNMVVMGEVMALTTMGSHNQTTMFQHRGHRVCRKTFLFLHGLGKRKFELIKAHFSSAGLVPRTHGNTGRTPAHALVMEDVKNIILFVTQHAEANAILLPGRIPGYKRSDIQILPSSTTKRAIWLLYEHTALQLSQRRIAYCTFCQVWRKFLPHVVVARPMTDLCATCQKNSAAIVRSVNLSEEEKSEALKTAEEHLMRATCERSLYRTVVKKSKDGIRQHFTTTSNAALSSGTSNAALSSGTSNAALSSGTSNAALSSGTSNAALSSGTSNAALSSGTSNAALSSLPGTVFSPPPPGSCIPSGSGPACVHYSFDFAQQVHYPHNPLQPGPMYFKTARKCAIFGVCCEGLPRQINYLIDEASDTGKGANTVVSLVHHFLGHHSLGETHLHLHADNCAGQNKNNTFLQYCAWRVLSGLHQSVTMSFMLVGHTKFAPDWCFGLLKQRFRRTFVSSLQDLVDVVNISADANVAQLVGTQDGEVVVPAYDWVSFLGGHFRRVPMMKSYHHFHFSSTSPGDVTMQVYSDSETNQFRMLVDSSWAPSPAILPMQSTPSGLSNERKWYLYNQIREFCRDGTKDLVCPHPSEPLSPAKRRPTTTVECGVDTTNDQEPPAKRSRHCKKCGGSGHDRRTCTVTTPSH